MAEAADLRARLAEAEEVLRAIRSGEVDALFIDTGAGGRVLTFEGSESTHRTLVEAMDEGAAILAGDGTVIYCNGRLATMLGAPLEVVMGLSLSRLLDPEDQPAFAAMCEEAKTGKSKGEVAFRRVDGERLVVQMSLSSLQVHGQPGVCLVTTDLTDRKRMEEELRSLTLVDELTGLLNRRGFFTLAEQELKLARRMDGRFFLLFVDLDGMKPINDEQGHAEGDRALTDAANVLRQTFRESDLVARLGGDEFAVLAMVSVRSDAEMLKKRLRRQLDAHNAEGLRPYHLSMSVGVTRYDHESPMTVRELLERADALMYEEKQLKRVSDTDSCRE